MWPMGVPGPEGTPVSFAADLHEPTKPCHTLHGLKVASKVPQLQANGTHVTSETC